MKTSGAVRRRPLRCIVALVLVSCSMQGWAAKCVVSSAGVNFGSYDALSSLNTDSTGTIMVDCNGQRIPHQILLSQGSSGSFNPRTMVSAGRQLQYNLYTDAARTNVWGDGVAGGTSFVSGDAVTATYTVYGRIPAGQKAWVGSYYDFLTITVNF